MDVTWHDCSDGRWPRTVPIGRPIANTQIHILDGRGQPVPLGVAGELHIGGVQVARGYLNRAALTAERFVADPFGGAGARLYKTGDLGRWLPDGSVEYLGRNDYQVKIRGFRIELGEIEAQLLACAGVREAVVLAREDQPGDKRLVAYLVADPARVPTPAELRAALAAALPDYMVPSAFVLLDVFPLTPNGKLDRKALPAPDGEALGMREYEAPEGGFEQAVAASVADLLGLERIGRHDNFFELGGHSLLAIQLMARLRETLGVELSLREPVRSAGAGGLRAGARQAPGAPTWGRSARPPWRAPCRCRSPSSACGSSTSWTAAGAAYHMPAALRLKGRLDKAALQAALDRIVARHEACAPPSSSVDGEPVQRDRRRRRRLRIGSARPAPRRPARSRSSCCSSTRPTEAAAPFDLASGPLIRGQLLCAGRGRARPAADQHHIVSDGWSIGVLMRELAALYAAFGQGEPDPLPPLAHPVRRLRGLAARLAAGRGAGRSRPRSGAHAGRRAGPAGAADRPSAPADAELCRRQRRAAAAGRADGAGCARLGRRHGTTLFMTLLAGWAALLARLSGQDDVVIGTPSPTASRAETRTADRLLRQHPGAARAT